MPIEGDNSHKSLVPPTHDDRAIITPEQVAKKGLFEQVALMYRLGNDIAQPRVDALVVNLANLKGLAQRLGYYYGMPPHRQTPEMVEELTKVGMHFLKGSEYENRSDKYLDAGLDLFKTIAVSMGTSEYAEWEKFLQEKTRGL